VVEPDRVRQRLDELLDEERELTDAVAATWQATAAVPLLHSTWAQVLEGRVDVSLDASSAALASTHGPRLATRRAGRRRAHRRARARVVERAPRRRAHLERRGRRRAWPINCAPRAWT
jgi:hypothetical protein